MNLDAGLVYVLRAVGTDIYKIGRTRLSSDSRRRALKGPSGESTILLESVLVEDAPLVESAIHAALQPYLCHRREWFHVDEITMALIRERLRRLGSHRVDIDVTFAVRISTAMAAQLDAYVAARTAREPGIHLTRTDAARILLGKALTTEAETGLLADAPTSKRGRR